MLKTKYLPIQAILFGLCVPLALAPFYFWPLIFVGVAGFFWLSFQATSNKQALLLGWLFGAGYFSLGVSWIYGSMQTVETPLWLSLVLTGGFCLLMALVHMFQMWFFHRFLRTLPFALIVVAPLWWLINEWIREWFLTGMPWLFAGYALSDTPIAQTAAVIGIYGLSLTVALSSAWFLKAYLSFQKANRRNAVIFIGSAIGLLLVLTTLGYLKPASSWTTPIEQIKTAAVQSNIDQRTKWSSAQQRPTLEFYGNAIKNLANADLVLWPEAAMTRRPDQIPWFLSQIQELGEKRDQAIITGMVTYDDGKFFNAMKGYGTATGEYRKQHLVPFGEYVPLEKWLRGLIAFFDLPMSSMYPAQTAQTPMLFELKGQPYFAAPIICYEATYPDLVRKLARDADIITVVSNDAWFGDSIGPHQHLQITQMRAIENGRDLLRATQNGVSALIDANGQILQKSEQFVEAQLEGELTLRTGLTPFQRIPSSTIPWFCIILVIAIYANKRRSNTAQTVNK